MSATHRHPARQQCITPHSLPWPPAGDESQQEPADSHLQRLMSVANGSKLDRREYAAWKRAPPRAVPPILHQTWKNCTPSSDHRRWRERCSHILPANWTLRLYTDAANRALIRTHFPSFLSLYDSYDTTIKRVDAARYFMLYLYGGVYVDLDMLCLRPFESLPLVPGEAAFAYVRTLGYDSARKCCKHDEALCTNGTCVLGDSEIVPNAFMAAPPRHPLFAQMLLHLAHAKDKPFHHKRGHPLAATGPVYLANNLRHWAVDRGRGHVRVHPATSIFLERTHGIDTRKHRDSHPCAFEGPLSLIDQLGERKCSSRSSEASKSECSAVRSWAERRANEDRVQSSGTGAGMAPELFECARRMPASVTTTFWTASWTPQYVQETEGLNYTSARNASRAASRQGVHAPKK